jgi:hypothetical protein
MKIRVDYASSCDGKEAFNTRQTAEKVIKRMNMPTRAHNRKASGHAPARCYKCPYCGWWHITGCKSLKK